jgi:hypothetical protein
MQIKRGLKLFAKHALKSISPIQRTSQTEITRKKSNRVGAVFEEWWVWR